MSAGYSSLFQTFSPDAGALWHLLLTVLVICAAIFAVVVGLITTNLVRFRGQPGAAEPRQIFGHRHLEYLWTAVPFLIVVWLIVLTYRAIAFVDRDPSQPPDLEVVGHQWWWEVRYPKSGVVTANEIHIPVGRPLLVLLRAADVIHDFRVPMLARGMDMIPGHPNHLWLEADRAGTYLGTCAEYCGAQHAWMRFRVIAQPPAEFDAWLRQQEQPMAIPQTDSARRGLEIFRDQTCITCHPIRGVSTLANAAPDLTHLADRETLGAGVLANTRANLIRWLENPQAIKPACLMPNLNLTAAEAADLADFLEPK